MESLVPGWTSVGNAGNGGAKEHKTIEENKGKAAAAPMNAASTPPITEPVTTAEPDISMNTLNRMLDIIAEQQKQIGEQQKLINELTHRLKSQQPSYGMTAEEIHRET